MCESIRDVRTLQFCRISPKSHNDKITKGRKDFYCDLNRNDDKMRCYFTLGNFDAICIYKTPDINASDPEWLSKVYTDKQRVITHTNANKQCHPMHLFSKRNNDDFWDEKTCQDFPFFLATFVYGVRRERQASEELLPNECSYYESKISKYLCAEAGNSKKLKFAVYNGISISDVVVLWYTKDIQEALKTISKIEFEGIARKTLTTIGFEMDNKTGAIKDNVLTHLDGLSDNRCDSLDDVGKMHITIRGSIKNYIKFQQMLERFNKILKLTYFLVCGENDFSLSTRIGWKALAELLEIYTKEADMIDDACWEIHTDLQIEHPITTADPSTNRQMKRYTEPTNILQSVYDKFLNIYESREQYKHAKIKEYPWAYAMFELLGTHSNIDKHPVLHGPSYMIYDSLRVANAYFGGDVKDFSCLNEDGQTRNEKYDLLLKCSKEKIFQFVRSCDQLTEQISRNDDVLQNGRSNAHPIHMSLPESALDFYHAFSRKVIDLLIAFDEDSNRKPDDFEYGFVLSPKLSERMRVSRVFDTEKLRTSNNDSGLIWPQKQVYVIEFPIEAAFRPIDFFVPLAHEFFHCFGDELRARTYRKRCMAAFIAANIVIAAGFDHARYQRLFVAIVKRIYGNDNSNNKEQYLNDALKTLEENARNCLGHEGLKDLFAEVQDAYYLYSDDTITQWSNARIYFEKEAMTQVISTRSIVRACSYYFRECYADTMMIALLQLTPDEYLRQFKEEVQKINPFGSKTEGLAKSSDFELNDSIEIALAQRIAIVLSTCCDKGLFDTDEVKDILEQKKPYFAGTFSATLHYVFSVLDNENFSWRVCKSYIPVFAMQYVKDYLKSSVDKLNDKYNRKANTLTQIRKDFDQIIRKGDMFGQRFYQIIYDYHQEVRDRVKEQEQTDHHPEAIVLMRKLQNGESLNTALYSFFDYLADGNEFKARESNGQEMVEFFLHLLQEECPVIKLDRDAAGYLKQRWNNIAVQIVCEQKDQAQILADDLAAECTIRPDEYVHLIANNWEQVGNNTYTFRFLAYLAKTIGEKLLDSPDIRKDFNKALLRITALWER